MSGCFENQWKAAAFAAVASLVGATAGRATTVEFVTTAEFLQAAISPQNAGLLSGLACRNLDRIVHLDLRVTWPEQALGVENDGYRRLVFWNDSDEFLFPKGTYLPLHGGYSVKGYFIPRAGGIHQGIASNYFEKIGDARVKREPELVEKKAASRACK